MKKRTELPRDRSERQRRREASVSTCGAYSLSMLAGVAGATVLSAPNPMSQLMLASIGLAMLLGVQQFVEWVVRMEGDMLTAETFEAALVRHSWMTVCFGIAACALVVVVGLPALDSDARFITLVIGAIAFAVAVVQKR